jgi:hypothetical protein
MAISVSTDSFPKVGMVTSYALLKSRPAACDDPVVGGRAFGVSLTS